MPTSIEAIVAESTSRVGERHDRLFEIRPDQPNLHLGLVVRERVGEGEEDGGARRAVIGADEPWLEERVVVAGQDENRLPRVGAHVEFADNVVHRHGPARRGRGEVVGLNLRAVFLQHPANEVLGLLVAG
jgi:hypothetical protein